MVGSNNEQQISVPEATWRCCGTALARRATSPTQGQEVILAATNSGFVHKRTVKTESNHGFYTEQGYDFDKIKQHCDNFVVLHSKDDQWVPYEAGVENAKGLPSF